MISSHIFNTWQLHSTITWGAAIRAAADKITVKEVNASKHRRSSTCKYQTLILWFFLKTWNWNIWQGQTKIKQMHELCKSDLNVKLEYSKVLTMAANFHSDSIFAASASALRKEKKSTLSPIDYVFQLVGLSITWKQETWQQTVNGQIKFWPDFFSDDRNLTNVIVISIVIFRWNIY